MAAVVSPSNDYRMERVGIARKPDGGHKIRTWRLGQSLWPQGGMTQSSVGRRRGGRGKDLERVAAEHRIVAGIHGGCILE